ncbi:SCP2 sterol-binding domain-containing protein [Spirillospora sp. CA-108201]
MVADQPGEFACGLHQVARGLRDPLLVRGRRTRARLAARPRRSPAGGVKPIAGFMSGKIKLSGDMMFGAKLAGWFDY